MSMSFILKPGSDGMVLAMSMHVTCLPHMSICSAASTPTSPPPITTTRSPTSQQSHRASVAKNTFGQSRPGMAFGAMGRPPAAQRMWSGA